MPLLELKHHGVGGAAPQRLCARRATDLAARPTALSNQVTSPCCVPGPSSIGQSSPSAPGFTPRRSVLVYAAALQSQGTSQQAPSTPTCIVTVPYKVQFGECLKLVGTGSRFGDWDASRGVALEWTEGDVWRTELALPVGHYEFKVVVYNTGTNEIIRWEEGEGGNRKLDVPNVAGSTIKLECAWGEMQAMVPVLVSPPEPSPVHAMSGAPANGQAIAAGESNGNGNGVAHITANGTNGAAAAHLSSSASDGTEAQISSSPSNGAAAAVADTTTTAAAVAAYSTPAASASNGSTSVAVVGASVNGTTTARSVAGQGAEGASQQQQEEAGSSSGGMSGGAIAGALLALAGAAAAAVVVLSGPTGPSGQLSVSSMSPSSSTSNGSSSVMMQSSSSSAISERLRSASASIQTMHETVLRQASSLSSVASQQAAQAAKAGSGSMRATGDLVASLGGQLGQINKQIAGTLSGASASLGSAAASVQQQAVQLQGSVVSKAPEMVASISSQISDGVSNVGEGISNVASSLVVQTVGLTGGASLTNTPSQPGH